MKAIMVAANPNRERNARCGPWQHLGF